MDRKLSALHRDLRALATRAGASLFMVPARPPAGAAGDPHAWLALTFVPQRYDGDLLLFNSTLGRDADTPGAHTRAPYVAGRIDSHDITTRHDHVTQPGSPAQIGPVPAERITESKETP